MCYFCASKTKVYHKFKDFAIDCCSKCKIAYTVPIPNIPVYEELDFHSCTKTESNRPFTTLHDLPRNWRKLINVQTDFVKKHLKANSKVLEIGCGEGVLLDNLKNSGFETYGIEPSKAAANRAVLRGLNVFNGYFPNQTVDEKVDLVVMSHVLEHIQDPCDIINSLKLASPGGFLMLTQTNYRGLIPAIQKYDWYAWVPEQHFWHFTLRGLTDWLSKFGFEMVEYKYTSLVHPENLLYKASLLREDWVDQFTVLYKLIV